MVNHSFEPMGSFGVDKQQRGFEIRSNRRGAEGSESTICYGHERKNDDLIRDYGFIMEGNPNDRLPMQEMEEAGMLVHRALLFATLGVDPAVSEDWRVRVGTSKREGAREGEGEGGGPDVAMRRLRACIDSFPCSNADGGFAPPRPTRGGAYWRQPSGVDSMRLELELAEPGILREQRDVADRVREHLEGLLERYPTSAEEDEALLLSSELSPRELAAVMHRLEAKKLIEAGVEALEAYWDELEL
eukprot:CAMPEP_0182857076 /NCGR_PEP_ID=MMETSP0034_2-20130328/2836_1 /TAXON_ID=156128 /ORGANISM="Nephroselmis pyriformis, Strain CCMP717" /LENGTH=244 /DNA_ID=CAMNT_0024988271 /DNA_START=182 /DNA_END=916 /DNA_ORIENTATION=-